MTDFGITPEHIESIATSWRSHGTELAAMTITPCPGGDGCATIDGFNLCTRSATSTVRRLGDELIEVGVALSRFNAVTVESDAAAAAEIAGAPR